MLTVLAHCWGGVHQFLFALMDNLLRSLEDLSRTELVWLNTYLAGRLRALPPENEQQPHPLPKAMPPVSVTMPGTTCSDGLPDATVAPLPERIDALNYSLDLWERTGAAPQGWCLSRDISNCDHKQGGLFLPLVSVASLHPGAMVTRNLGCSMLPGVSGRLLHLLASLLVILSARTLAGTVDVDRVMSELSMTTTRAMIVNNVFCTPKECLVPHGSPR